MGDGITVLRAIEVFELFTRVSFVDEMLVSPKAWKCVPPETSIGYDGFSDRSMLLIYPHGFNRANSLLVRV